MTTVEITLDDDMADFVEQERQAKGFESTAEYVRSLVVQKQLLADRERVESLLLEAVNSGPTMIVDDEYWERFEREHFGRVLGDGDEP